MAIRASTQVPDRAYSEFRSVALQLDRLAEKWAPRWGSGGNANQVLLAIPEVVSFRERLVSLATTPGLAAYAQEQENDPGYDVVAEYNALIVAIDSLLTELVAVLPVSSPGGYAEAFVIGNDGTFTYRQFNASELANVVTALNNVAASVI